MGKEYYHYLIVFIEHFLVDKILRNLSTYPYFDVFLHGCCTSQSPVYLVLTVLDPLYEYEFPGFRSFKG